MTLEPNDSRHGTLNGYTNHDCRCKPCCTANTENNRRYMQMTPEQRSKSDARVKAWRAAKRKQEMK